MDNLTHLFQQFTNFSKANPMAATLWSVWGLGVCSFLLRNVPAKIFGMIKHQCTTSLSFNSSSVGTSAETFANFLRWYEEKQWAKLSRSMSITGLWGETNGSVVGVGEGSHFFMYKGRPFWMKRTRLDQGTGFQLVYEIRLTALGRSRNAMIQLIEEFRYKPKDNQLCVYTLKGADWVQLATVAKRPLETVIIEAELKAGLLQKIGQWRESRAWYEERGLPYKLTCILHGEPGTGKTSLIKALAGHYGMHICLINLNLMTDSMLERALSSAPSNSVIVIEDFDSSSATHARRGLPKASLSPPVQDVQAVSALNDVPVAPTESPSELQLTIPDSLQCLTLSGLLNALDGVMALDEKLIFLTTNVYHQLDPALLRKGRVDHTYEIKRLTHTEVVAYVELMFPGALASHMPAGCLFKDILGCDLQDLYFQYRHDAAALIRAIPHTDERVVVKLLDVA